MVVPIFAGKALGKSLLIPLARHTHRLAVAQREGAATLYAICSMQFLNGTTASSKSIVDQATLLPEPSASALKRGMGIRRPLATGNMPKDHVQSREGAPGSRWVVEFGLSSSGCRVRVVEFGWSGSDNSGCRVQVVELRRGSADVVEFVDEWMSGWLLVIQCSSPAQMLVWVF